MKAIAVMLTMLVSANILTAQSGNDIVDISNKDQRIKFSSLNAGIVFGKFLVREIHEYYDHGTLYHQEINLLHNYWGFGAGISHTWKNGQFFFQHFTFKLYLIQDNYHKESLNEKETITNYVFNPFYKLDWKLSGFGFGLHIGDFMMAKMTESHMAGGLQEFKIYPQFSIRLGPKEYLYIEYKFLDILPAGTPMPFNQIGLYSGLGKLEKNKIGLGWADKSGFLNIVYAISRSLLAEVYYQDNFKPGIENVRTLAINAHYRFNFKNMKPY